MKFLTTTLLAIAVLILAAECGKSAPDAKQTADAAQPAVPDASPTPISRYAGNPGDSVFTVSAAEELAMLARIVNGTWGGDPEMDDFRGKTVKLTGNIDLSAYDNWAPIGRAVSANSSNSYVYSFSGIFDGGGHIVSNLTINRPDSYEQGLFGYISHGIVKNLGLDNVNVSGKLCAGGVAGSIVQGAVVNCYSTGAVNGHYSAGGIAGSVRSGIVANCYSACAVSGHFEVGGVAGKVTGKLLNCYATGAVSGKWSVGGITGSNSGEKAHHGSVINCAALNPRVSASEKRAGRVLGDIKIYADRKAVSNNAACARMKNKAGNTAWPNKIADGEKANDGIDITAAAINSDGTLGGRFKSADGWTIAPGYLPGLGKAVEMPPHLQADSAAVKAERAKIRSNGNGGNNAGAGADSVLSYEIRQILARSASSGWTAAKGMRHISISSSDFLKNGAVTGSRSRADILRGAVESANITIVRHECIWYLYSLYEARKSNKDEAAASAFPNFNGKVTVRFSINESGKVTGASLAGSTVNNAGLEAAVVNGVKNWEFEKIDKPGDITEVVYPLIFSIK